MNVSPRLPLGPLTPSPVPVTNWDRTVDRSPSPHSHAFKLFEEFSSALCLRASSWPPSSYPDTPFNAASNSHETRPPRRLLLGDGAAHGVVPLPHPPPVCSGRLPEPQRGFRSLEVVNRRYPDYRIQPTCRERFGLLRDPRDKRPVLQTRQHQKAFEEHSRRHSFVAIVHGNFPDEEPLHDILICM